VPSPLEKMKGKFVLAAATIPSLCVLIIALFYVLLVLKSKVEIPANFTDRKKVGTSTRLS